MTPSATLRTLGWLVRDTFRQSRASGVFWILLAVSVLATLVCLSAGVDGAAPLAYPGEQPDFLPRADRDSQDLAKVKQSGVIVLSGDLTLAFGAIRIPLARDAQGAVHFLELVLAGGVADTLGLMLTLIWTAGFLPGFLETRSIAVLLAKPVPRWCLLVGKYIGVLTFVLASSTVFVLGTWGAIGLRTGIWEATYLYAIPLLLLHFAMFFSVSALLAVWSQSTVVCVFGSILFWCVAWSINFGRHTLTAAADAVSTGSFSSGLDWLLDACYWVLPKPADVSLLLFNAIEADGHFSRIVNLSSLEAHGFSFVLSIASSLVFTVAILVLSARKLTATDY
jgi:ABC-type transport system involved in multi-copper enzyme maturation permease subunit